MLLIAMLAIVVMASLNRYGMLVEELMVSISIKVAVVLIAVYTLGLMFIYLYVSHLQNSHRNFYIPMAVFN